MITTFSVDCNLCGNRVRRDRYSWHCLQECVGNEERLSLRSSNDEGVILIEPRIEDKESRLYSDESDLESITDTSSTRDRIEDVEPALTEYQKIGLDSKLELDLLLLVKKHNLSLGAGDDIIKLLQEKAGRITKSLPKNVSKIQNKLDNYLALNACIGATGPRVLSTTITLSPLNDYHKSYSIELMYQDPSAFIDRIKLKYFEDLLFAPSTSNGRYDDINTGLMAIHLQQCARKVHNDTNLLTIPIMYATDASNIGLRKGQPFVITLGCLPREERDKISGKHLVGYYPDTTLEDVSNSTANERKKYERSAKHHITKAFMDVFKQWTEKPLSWSFKCKDGSTKHIRCLFVHLCMIADYPEANFQSGFKATTSTYYPCRYCTVPSELLWDTRKVFPERNYDQINLQLYRYAKEEGGESTTSSDEEDDYEEDIKDNTSTSSNSDEDEKEEGDSSSISSEGEEIDPTLYLKKNSIQEIPGTHCGFDIPKKSYTLKDELVRFGVTPAKRIPFELLHALLLGAIKHLVVLTFLVFKNDDLRKSGVTITACELELTKRISSFKSVKLGHNSYSSTFSNLKSVAGLTARAYRYLSQQFVISIGDGSFFFKKKYAKIYLDMIWSLYLLTGMLCSKNTWNETRLQELDKLALNFGYKFKTAFQSVSKCGFIKLHAVIHFSEDIKLYGSPFNVIAQSFEYSHIAFFKKIFVRTNRSKNNGNIYSMIFEVLRRETLAGAAKAMLKQRNINEDDSDSEIYEEAINDTYSLSGIIGVACIGETKSRKRHRNQSVGRYSTWSWLVNSTTSNVVYLHDVPALRGSPSMHGLDQLEVIGHIIEDSLYESGDVWSDLTQIYSVGSSEREVVFYRGMTIGDFKYHANANYRTEFSRFDYVRFLNNDTITGPCWYAQIICIFKVLEEGYVLIRWLRDVNTSGYHLKIKLRYLRFTNTNSSSTPGTFHYDVRPISEILIDTERYQLPPFIVNHFDASTSESTAHNLRLFDLQYK